MARLLESEVLRSSESQRRLLRYLAEKSIEGTADQLKEYTVGVEGLGKPASYDPRQDPSVRIQAGKLRLRLEEYYRTEGAANPLRIEFPKGHFKLVFRQEAGPPANQAGVEPARRWRQISVLLGALLAASIAVGVYTGVRLRRLENEAGGRGALWTPEVAQIWSPFLTARPAGAALPRHTLVR